MNPEQQGNPYQFIVNPEKPAKRPLIPFLGGGSSFMMKLLFIVGGAVVLMIVLAVVVNLFFSKSDNIEGTVKLTQSATEIVRVGNQAERANDQAIRDAAAGTGATLDTQRQALVTYLADQGREVDGAEQSLTMSTTTDDKLTEAEKVSSFDETFSKIMRDSLTAYASDLQTVYDSTGDKAERSMLSEDYKQVQTLLKLWPEQP
jgi:hypothetical protein